MCGRYALGLPHNDVQQLEGYNLDIGEWVDEDSFVPRYNIAPRTFAPVIRAKRDSANNYALMLHSMKFGLVPHWAKHEDNKLNTINARSEALVDGGGMWETMKRTKRCIVVAQGYFEWLKKGRDRIPHFVKHQDGKLMLFAGLYDCANLEGVEKPLWSFSIVTTYADKEFDWLHDRQPVILSSQEAIMTWLDPCRHAWTSELTKLVQPYRDLNSPLQCYPVPKEVGKVGSQSPTFIQPVSQRKDGIQAIFSKQQDLFASSQQKRKQLFSPSASVDEKSSLVQKKRIKREGDLDNHPDIEHIGIADNEIEPQRQSKNKGRESQKVSYKDRIKSSGRSPNKSTLKHGLATSGTSKITDFFKP